MATLKMKKMPKAPKKNASIEAMEHYLNKVKEIKKENADRVAKNKKRDALYAQILKTRRG